MPERRFEELAAALAARDRGLEKLQPASALMMPSAVTLPACALTACAIAAMPSQPATPMKSGVLSAP